MQFKISVVTVLLLVCSSMAYAGGGGGITGGATEMTQLANKAQLVDQLREQVQQTQQLIQQYQNMLTNTLQLPQNIWNDITGELSGLQDILGNAQSMTFSAGVDHEKFAMEHPGYREEKTTENFSVLYKKRVENWKKYWEAAFQANNMAVEGIKDSQSLIEQLSDAAKSSEGQHQALQAGNQISVYMAQQLSEVRMDMQRQMDAQAEFALNEQQERTDELAAMEKAIGTWQPEAVAPKGY